VTKPKKEQDKAIFTSATIYYYLQQSASAILPMAVGEVKRVGRDAVFGREGVGEALAIKL
jgi:hypothetical protein